MSAVSITITDVVEEIVDDAGTVRSAKSREFHSADKLARDAIQSILGEGKTSTRDLSVDSEGHQFGGHGILSTVVDTVYTLTGLKLGKDVLNALKAWININSKREVRVSYYAKSGTKKEIKISGYNADSTEELYKLIIQDPPK